MVSLEESKELASLLQPFVDRVNEIARESRSPTVSMLVGAALRAKIETDNLLENSLFQSGLVAERKGIQLSLFEDNINGSLPARAAA